MELSVTPIEELSEKEKNDIDNFIMSPDTNGEFINSLKYLSYHGGRFNEDSIVVRDQGSNTVKGVLLATVDTVEPTAVVSHQGTTFSGPIICLKDSYQTVSMVMELMLAYYENKYNHICLRTTPAFYARQEAGIIDYILMRKNYIYGMIELSNIIRIEKIDSEESLFKNYDSKRRNQVRKALKNSEFIFNKVQRINTEVWKIMNDNLMERYSSKTTHSYEEIDGLQSMMPDYIQPYEVRHISGEYAAFGLVYKFKNVYHTQYLDMNYKYAADYPNLMLIHNLILEARKEGFPVFSFGACTEKKGEYLNEGLLSYKAGFGGGNIILPEYSKDIIY